MVVAASSGPDWSSIMTAFGTVGAVIAAVGIALWSTKTTNKRVEKEWHEADERLRRQLEHSDEQLRRQHEYSDRRLAEERAATEERSRRERVGFVHAWLERNPNWDEAKGQSESPLRYVVRNDGPLPVYSVVLYVPWFNEVEQRLVMANIGIGMLTPDQMVERLAPSQLYHGKHFGTSPMPIFFTDSNGDRWLRDDHGALIEYTDPSKLKLDKFMSFWEVAPPPYLTPE